MIALSHPLIHPKKEHYKESERCWTQIWQNIVNLFDCTKIFLYLGLNGNDLYIGLSLVSESFFWRLCTGREICKNCIQNFQNGRHYWKKFKPYIGRLVSWFRNFLQFYVWEVLGGFGWVGNIEEGGYIAGGQLVVSNMGKKGGGEY